MDGRKKIDEWRYGKRRVRVWLLEAGGLLAECAGSELHIEDTDIVRLRKRVDDAMDPQRWKPVIVVTLSRNTENNGINAFFSWEAGELQIAGDGRRLWREAESRRVSELCESENERLLQDTPANRRTLRKIEQSIINAVNKASDFMETAKVAS